MKNLAFLTIDRIADILQLNKMTVYREIKRQHLRAYKFGKEFRVLQADFEAYLANAYKAAQQSVLSHNTCIKPNPVKAATKAKMARQSGVKQAVHTPKQAHKAKTASKTVKKAVKHPIKSIKRRK